MKKLIILAIVLLCTAVVFADSPGVFTWDANTEADLAGYRIYFSDTSGNYQFGGNTSPNFLAEIPCGPNDTSCCTWSKPNLGGPGYYYVATAYDTQGNESLPSNEVENLPPGQVKNLKFTK